MHFHIEVSIEIILIFVDINARFDHFYRLNVHNKPSKFYKTWTYVNSNLNLNIFIPEKRNSRLLQELSLVLLTVFGISYKQSKRQFVIKGDEKVRVELKF